MMKSIRKSISSVVVLLTSIAVFVALLGLAGCSTGGPEGADGGSNGKISVVTSVNQWLSVAQQIGGDKVDAKAILANSNIEAHDYEPQPSDIATLTGASVVIVNGASYDSWALKALESSSATVVNAAELSGVKDGDNPHVWFSAETRQAVGKAFLDALVAKDAADKAYFEQQYQTWLAGETTLDGQLSEAKQKLSGVTYAATESVAYYLTEDLGITDVTPQGYLQAIANDSEPAPSDLTAFTGILSDGEADVLFVNTQEISSTTTMITDAASKAGVPTVDMTESMPAQYSSLEEWMTALVSSIESAVSVS
jgi:zinc/manganese transport system substrate-binding protein